MSVARPAGMRVVVVVPAVAEREPGQPGQVAAVVGERVGPPAVAVPERGDGERKMEEEHSAHAEAPNDELRPVGAERGRVGGEGFPGGEQEQREARRRQPVEALEPNQLRDAQEVRDGLDRRARAPPAQQPADLRPEQPAHTGRVRVARDVGVPMVKAVLCRPPERAQLASRCAEPGQRETRRATRAKGAVRESAVVARREAEETHEHERHARGQGRGGHIRHEGGRAKRVHPEQWNAGARVEAVLRRRHGGAHDVRA